MNVSEVAGKRVEHCPAYYAFPVCLPSLEKKSGAHVLGRCVHGEKLSLRRISFFRDASFVFTSK